MDDGSARLELFVRRVEWGPRKVTASVVIGGEEHDIRISANEDLFQETDFLFPATLLPAMKVGAPLKLPGGMSPRLLSSARQIQDIFGMWESAYGHIPIEAETRDADGTGNETRGAACFFSGGVDSFHTLLRHRQEISHAIYIHPRTERPIFGATTDAVREASKELGKTLIEVQTNLPDFARETRVSWKYYHGTCIAASALLFQHLFDKVFIAGSTTSNYDNLRPMGTHPILDPLWGTELTRFHHDGCEVRRVDKADHISEHEAAMKHLMVCADSEDESNCGRCEKCLRTMLNLKAAGTLEQCDTLPDEIPLDAVAALDLSSYSAAYFARENLRALERLGTAPDLAQALEDAIHKGATRIAHSGYTEEALDRAHARINALRERAARLKQRNERLKSTNEKLKARNAAPTTHPSPRRHKMAADTVAERLFRLPGLRRFFK